MYLELKIGDETLDLYANTKAKFTYSNPAFESKGGYSLPFTIPKSPKNLRITGFVDRFDSVTTQKVDANIWLGGIPFDNGVIKMKSASDRSIEVYFEKKETDLYTNLALLRIKELLQSLTIGVASYTLIYEALSAGPTVIIIIDDVVFEHIRDVANDTPASIAIDLRNQINAVYPLLATVNGAFITLSSTENHHVSSSGLILDTANSTFYESSVIAIWTSYFNTLTNNDFVFATIRNQAVNNTIKEINAYSGGYLFSNSDFSDVDNPIYNYSVAPFFLLTTILEAIETKLDIDFIGSFLDSQAVQGLILLHQKNIDTVIKKTLGNNYVVVPSLTIIPSDFLPDLTADVFLQNLLDFFCAYITLNETSDKVTIKQRSDLLLTVVKDWTSKATVAYKLIPKTGDGYRIDLLVDKNDDYSPISTLIQGNGASEYKIDVAISKSWTNSVVTNLPFLNEYTKTEIVLKFANWVGLAGNTYPKCTAFSIDEVGEYWEDWALFLTNAKKINMDFVLNINDLLQLRAFDAPLRKIETQDGSVVGMISEFSFEADNNGLSLVDVELFTVN